MYADCDQHLQGHASGCGSKGSATAPRLSAGDASIDDGSRALLEYHGDAQVATDLKAVRSRQGHQELPRGQRPYGLRNLLLGRIWSRKSTTASTATISARL